MVQDIRINWMRPAATTTTTTTDTSGESTGVGVSTRPRLLRTCQWHETSASIGCLHPLLSSVLFTGWSLMIELNLIFFVLRNVAIIISTWPLVMSSNSKVASSHCVIAIHYGRQRAARVIAVTAGISLTKEDSSAVQWWKRGVVLSLVDIKSAQPPLPYDTLVTWMARAVFLCILCILFYILVVS